MIKGAREGDAFRFVLKKCALKPDMSEADTATKRMDRCQRIPPEL